MLNESGGKLSLVSVEKFDLPWGETFTNTSICLLGLISFPLAPVPTPSFYVMWAAYIREYVSGEWMWAPEKGEKVQS